VGGRDFRESPFNRAIDAKRQPGSAFKPFIFAMALESGYAPSTQLEGLDQPIATAQGPWLPGGEHETTSVRLRDALVVSSNRAAAHLLQEVGVNRTLDLVQRFGVSSKMPNVPSLALGTGEMSLFELTSAYGVFANRGVWREPTMIRRVVDRYGREIYRAPEAERPVISEATAYLMSSMMADVINRGTAHTARAAGFRLPAAGKTGTSQSYADAWFVGYTPSLVTGVWIGYDKPQTIMNRGFAGVVAVPVWARFMAAALRGATTDWYEMPGSLMKVKLCRISGLLATDQCHLPVVGETFAHTEADAAGAAIREGGVYDELRHVSRLPETCPLPHGEGVADHAATDVAHPSLGSVSDSTTSPGAAVIMRELSTAAPSSMRPIRPVLTPDASELGVRRDVLTIDPDAGRAWSPSERPSSVAPPAQRPNPQLENGGVIPGSRIEQNVADPPAPAAAPGIFPGSTITTTPPRPPGNGSPDGPPRW
jgi:membrane peptidoglycan carboxypeptidase